MQSNTNDEMAVRDMLKSLSAKDFLKIGMNEIAYIRPFPVLGQSESVAVYAADGTQLSVLESVDLALATIRHNDLMPVTLH